jgi:hypothetical protein
MQCIYEPMLPSLKIKVNMEALVVDIMYTNAFSSNTIWIFFVVNVINKKFLQPQVSFKCY